MRSATHATIPLFPLNTVLFPGGPLRLRIFEPRYLDMVSRCMREDTGFGVALIVEGREAGGAAQTVQIGTLARIVDFEQLEGGLLGITARGERRFRIVHGHQESDGLNVCQVEWLEDEPRVEIPPQHAVLAELLRRALEQIGPAYGEVTPAYEDSTWVGLRLAEILPLAAVERQELLELNDGPERLQWLQSRLDIQESRDEDDPDN
jgi:Lon protease-like protein